MRGGTKGGVAALLFDLGGIVLAIDWERVFSGWARDGEHRAAIRAAFAMDDAYHRHERGELPFSGYADHLRRRLGLDLDDAAVLAGWNDIFVGPVPGMADLLASAARRWPVDAFTNTNAVHQAAWSARYPDLLRPFRTVYSSCALGARKPDPQAFLLVAARMGVAPANVLFFDDTAENVTGAEAAGMQAVLVDPTGNVASAIRDTLESLP